MYALLNYDIDTDRAAGWRRPDDREQGRAFVFYHHHLVEFPRSDPLAFGGAVAVRSQAASPRGPGHPREELTKSDNLGWRPAQTSSHWGQGLVY